MVDAETYDRKVALPTPGLPRKIMSTSGMGLPSGPCVVMVNAYDMDGFGHIAASIPGCAVLPEGKDKKGV